MARVSSCSTAMLSVATRVVPSRRVFGRDVPGSALMARRFSTEPRSVRPLLALGDDLRAACREEWHRGTEGHRFIAAVKEGSIKAEQFDTWLLQDYLYVQEFIRFAGLVIAKAPREEGMLLLLEGSFAVLADELRWFHSTLTERGVAIDSAELQPANQRYCAAMRRWGRELDWGMAVLAYFAIESSYNAAWSSCATAPEPYRSWALRWGSPEFSAFCDGLEAAAETSLKDPSTGAIPPDRMEAAIELFREVLLLEEEFWSMAYEDST